MGAMGEDVDWGGDRRSGTAEKEYGNEYKAKDFINAKKYSRDKHGKREFKGGSPLYTGKGGTIVAREGLLNSLKKKFGKIFGILVLIILIISPYLYRNYNIFGVITLTKSSGYNYGTDASLERKYELAIAENLNKFVSFLPDVDIKNCKWN